MQIRGEKVFATGLGCVAEGWARGWDASRWNGGVYVIGAGRKSGSLGRGGVAELVWGLKERLGTERWVSMVFYVYG